MPDDDRAAQFGHNPSAAAGQYPDLTMEDCTWPVVVEPALLVHVLQRINDVGASNVTEGVADETDAGAAPPGPSSTHAAETERPLQGA